MTNKSLYLDLDTTPALAGRYSHGGVEAAKRKAFKLLKVVESGQIGIYEDCRGGGFKGYAIKDRAGAEPRFEAAADEGLSVEDSIHLEITGHLPEDF